MPRKKGKPGKKISAVICTYNRYPLMEKAIDSCLDQSLNEDDYEVIIVDNSPPSPDMEVYRERYEDHPVVRYIVESIPGLSNARNVATREADSPYVAFLDDDAIASHGWLEGVLTAFERFGDKVGVVGGRIDPIWETGRPSWVSDKLLGHFSVVNWGGECRIAKKDEWFAGANVSFRKSALEAVGGFDVSLGRTGGGAVLLSNEETAVSDKIQELGYQLVYAPEARVDHLVESKRTEQSWVRRRMSWQAVSDFIKMPSMFLEDRKGLWGVVSEYYSHMKPEHRTLVGLSVDVDDPELFMQQVNANYCMTALLLMGGYFPDFDHEGS
ncbi:glycosyltransferase [Henriciella mobilis]|uniref:Glycosyltransferase family 2 protein n=1 Tax=Henriciella mobilis TaxID=2305467 RepID=A0A399RPR1_9PROT|nr:glycosyltransferase family 2 protein [Henriciella mobilis]RIJ32313.1 glycosyltransferase family 2 protein [Henriciella mobilis]